MGNAISSGATLRSPEYDQRSTSMPSSSSSTSQSPAASQIVEIPAQCPMSSSSSSSPILPSSSSTKNLAPAQCPIAKPSSARDSLASLPINQDNMMPDLPNTAHSSQSASLPTDRETSSIPKSTGGVWEYPSPQQFYNALVRKGWETPEEHVASMVAIHNWLNEDAWNLLLKWEKREGVDSDSVQLVKFEGKPGQLSPRARMYSMLGTIFPATYSSEPPFDRHDWLIARPNGKQIRYVIDYYSLPDEADGNPAFSLDVRPALDSWGSIKARIEVSTKMAWRKAMTGVEPDLAEL